MTRIRFVGDVPLWAGLALAFVVCVLAFRFYRREVRDTWPTLRWLLPTLRSVAFLLGILVLTGPVLRHQTVTGEPGSVQIYVDGSQSMELLDRHLSAGRKLLIAEQQQWLDSGTVDAAKLNLADSFAQLSDAAAAELAAGAAAGATTGPVLNGERAMKLRDALLNAFLQVEDQAEVTGNLETLQLPNSDQELAAAKTRLQEAIDAIPEIERRLRKEFDQQVQQLVNSGDRAVQAALSMFDETPRWRRAERSVVTADNSLFQQLRPFHRVEVLTLENAEAVSVLNTLNDRPASEFLSEAPFAATTDLASGLTTSQSATGRDGQAETDAHDSAADDIGASVQPVASATNVAAPIASASASASRPGAAIVLVTDGQHNSGPSPVQLARLLGKQGVPVYPVSLGADRRAPDIAVVGVEHPDLVFEKDRVRGTVILQDHMPAGQPLLVEVVLDDKTLWNVELLTQDVGERRIDFEFSLDDVIQQLGGDFDPRVTQHAVPLALTARVAPLPSEAEMANNQRVMRLAAMTQKYRLLMIDGRSRWETRYLRNAFERDTQWVVSAVVAGPGTADHTLPRGSELHLFPDSREALFAYDLIVFGEVDRSLFAEQELQWLREFVEIRGGGIVLLDGARGHLQQLTDQDLRPLLPVEWNADPLTSKPSEMQLTDVGQRQPALSLTPDATANAVFWKQLPPPRRINSVTALPGAEVLVEAVVDSVPRPLLVTRLYGAGRVLYLAADETWRWRYKAADTWHQRIWHQLARYVMPRPFAASDEYLAIDTGAVSYQQGETAPVRIRLRGLDGKPLVDATVDALLWKDDRVVATTTLQPDPAVPGIYQGVTAQLEKGEYRVSVQASGFSQEALKATSRFVVLPRDSGELEESAANLPLLQQMAAESGGVCLREEDIGQLVSLLNPLSQGRITESETLIWQSYWWFASIVGLLAMEWFLRKRAGLL